MYKRRKPPPRTKKFSREPSISPYYFFSAPKHLLAPRKKLVAKHIRSKMSCTSDQPDDNGIFCLDKCWFSQVPKTTGSVVFRIDTRNDTIYHVGSYGKDGFHHADKEISFPLR